MTSFALCSQVLAQPHLKGRWDEPPPVNDDYAWPSGAMHCTLLATGKVLYWYSPGCDTPETYAYLWDPRTGSQTRVPNTGIEGVWDCNAQSALANGDLLVIGGGCGLPSTYDNQARLFRLAGSPTGPWQQLPDMSYERWYATNTTLQDGRVLVTAGMQFDEQTQTESSVTYPELYDPGEPWDPWQTLLTASKPNMPVYSYLFLLPGGDVFFAGPAGSAEPWPPAAVLDTDTWTWTDVGSGPIDFWGAVGSAVMYLPGKVLKAGGGQFCSGHTGDAAIIDMTQPSPTWQEIDPLVHARKDLNLVIGATGLVYAIGGQIEPCPTPECDICVPVKWAESIDLSAAPLQWIQLAEATIPRGYHSTALLLPSGKILSCGGEDEPQEPGEPPPPSISAEIFSPPYLFQPKPGDPSQSIDASRPQIGYVPSEITYDTQFTVSMPEPLLYIISKVSLIRLGAVTHGFDMDQRFVPLEFMQTGFNLQITAPEDGSIAPPGYYMLFLVSAPGVPSEAAILKVSHLLP